MDDPMANSSVLVLPRMTTPASSRRWTLVAVYGGRKPSRMREPAVAGIPCTHSTSLIATGIPVRREAAGAASRRARRST